MPEVLFRCREQITDETSNSVCLIKTKFSPADAVPKKCPDDFLVGLIRINRHKDPIKRFFMLHYSINHSSLFIPTSQVSMQGYIDLTVNHYQDTHHLETNLRALQDSINLSLSSPQASPPNLSSFAAKKSFCTQTYISQPTAQKNRSKPAFDSIVYSSSLSKPGRRRPSMHST